MPYYLAEYLHDMKINAQIRIFISAAMFLGIPFGKVDFRFDFTYLMMVYQLIRFVLHTYVYTYQQTH